MYTLAIATQKGGTGKTTTAAALAAELTKAGYNLLVVDADPQGNLSRTMLQDQAENTLYDVLQNRVPAASATYKARYGHIIAPGDGLKGKDPITDPEPAYALKRALEGQKRAYDICIIDCPPNLGQLTVAALTAADGVIVPARPERYSIDGLRELERTCHAIRQSTNKRLQLLGVIITQYQQQVVLQQGIVSALGVQARALRTKVYQPPVRFTATVGKWQYEGVTRCTAQQDYAELTAQILADMKLK